MKLSPCKALLLGFIGSSAAGLPSLEALYPSAALEVAEHVSFRGGGLSGGPFERFMENNPETPIRAHTLILLRTACFRFKKALLHILVYLAISKVLYI